MKGVAAKGGAGEGKPVHPRCCGRRRKASKLAGRRYGMPGSREFPFGSSPEYSVCPRGAARKYLLAQSPPNKKLSDVRARKRWSWPNGYGRRLTMTTFSLSI